MFPHPRPQIQIFLGLGELQLRRNSSKSLANPLFQQKENLDSKSGTSLPMQFLLAMQSRTKNNLGYSAFIAFEGIFSRDSLRWLSVIIENTMPNAYILFRRERQVFPYQPKELNALLH